MDFGSIFGRDKHREHVDEISKIKQEFEKEDKIFEKELQPKYNLLQEFEINDLRNLCVETTGHEPPIEYYNDPKSGRKEIMHVKEDYVQFLVDELRLDEIISYALKKKIVSKEILKKFKQHD